MQRFPLTFLMRVDQAFFDLVDAWRRHQPDLPSRAEAIRRLVDKGLAADEGQERAR